MRFLFQAVFCTCILAGCAARRPAALAPSAPLSPGSASAAIAEIQSRSARLQSARTLYASTIENSSGDLASFRYVLAFSAPDSVRLETIPDNAAYTLTLLTAHSGRFKYIDTVEKEAVTGEAAPAAGEKAFGIPLMPHQLAYLLLGTLPPDYCEQEQCLAYQTAEGQLLLTDSSGSERYLFSANGRITTVQLFDQFRGTLLAQMDLAYEGKEIPDTAVFHLFGPGFEAKLALLEADLNGQIPAHLFDIRIPRSYRTREF